MHEERIRDNETDVKERRVMNHEEKSITEFNLEEYIQSSNDVNILVTASYYNETSIGTYRCLLLYKQHKKLIEGML